MAHGSEGSTGQGVLGGYPQNLPETLAKQTSSLRSSPSEHEMLNPGVGVTGLSVHT